MQCHLKAFQDLNFILGHFEPIQFLFKILTFHSIKNVAKEAAEENISVRIDSCCIYQLCFANVEKLLLLLFC